MEYRIEVRVQDYYPLARFASHNAQSAAKFTIDGRVSVMVDSRDLESRQRRAEGDRVKAVRESLRLKQPDFAAMLTDEARRQGRSWLRYDVSMVSRLENGSRDLSIDDTAIIAGIDPERRGKLWLGWEEKDDPSTRGTLRSHLQGNRAPAPTLEMGESKTPEQIERELAARKRGGKGKRAG